MQNSGKPEDSSQAKLEERRFGEARRFTKGAADKDARFEATRRSTSGTSGRCRMRGDPEPHRKVEKDDDGPSNLLGHRD
jgi:hypothetical protein